MTHLVEQVARIAKDKGRTYIPLADGKVQTT